jgi:polysaccharide deacetylase family protein (PEP-CTERM system associated)
MNAPVSPQGKLHLLTVHLEDYFQVGTLRSVIPPHNWYRFETRVERNTQKTLEMLDEFNLKATFFALGWVADQLPEVIRQVAEHGHEVASKGYYHRSIREMTPSEFRDDLQRSREAIERASERKVYGYRTARGWFRPEDLWALDILSEEGFAYDSSIRPQFRTYAHEPWRRFAHQHRRGGTEIWEFPLPSVSLGGWCLPIAGGNYHRQIPHWMMKRWVAHWDTSYDAPFVMYFHVWELDPNQPRINAAPLWQRVRQYRNLGKMSWMVPAYLQRYAFMGIADYLQLPSQVAAATTSSTREPSREPKLYAIHSGNEIRLPRRTTGKKTEPVTLVVPCYNEELSLSYLANTLKSVEESLAPDYELLYVFVDDNSRDATWETLQRIFGQNPKCKLLRHPKNLGVAAAILTGLRHAETEVVASIDCDCTYDPHQLQAMLPLMTEGVDLVTASPYHPLGRVLNVPEWRLGLSKGLSMIYGWIVPQKLSTYTSCFRIYRRSAVAEVSLSEGGFLGVAEMLVLLNLLGRRIVEFPAVLEVRLLGQSKMKVLKTIFGHLRLITRILFERRNLRKNRYREALPTPIIGPAETQEESSPLVLPNQGGGHHV